MAAVKKSKAKKAGAKRTAKVKAATAVKPATGPERHRVFGMQFARIYAAWLNKVERKGRTPKDLDKVIGWLTGYTAAELKKCLKGSGDLGAFFDHCPAFNPAATLITGTVCGVRVEEVAEPSMRRMRQLDKLIDELAQGRAMEKILRQ